MKPFVIGKRKQECEITKKILELVKSKSDPDVTDEITPEKPLSEISGLDSLDKVEAIMAVEAEYDLHISDEVAEGFKNIQEVINYVKLHKEMTGEKK
jgi:acyl carrier protein